MILHNVINHTIGPAHDSVTVPLVKAIVIKITIISINILFNIFAVLQFHTIQYQHVPVRQS
jgi:hypothetical protein